MRIKRGAEAPGRYVHCDWLWGTRGADTELTGWIFDQLCSAGFCCYSINSAGFVSLFSSSEEDRRTSSSALHSGYDSLDQSLD